MKKLKVSVVFCLLFSIMCTGIGFAQDNEVKLACPFVRVTTNLLGYNFLAKKIAQGVLKKTLKESAKGEYKVKFDSYSGVDLKKGKFKSLTITGENISVDDDIFISKLYMTTLSNLNHVDYKKKPMVFITDIPMSYEVEITEADLNKTMSMGKSYEIMSTIIPLVKISKPKITIDNEKIRMSSSAKLPFAKPIKFSMSTGLKVEDGKLVMTDIQSTGSGGIAAKFIEMINTQDLLDDINIDVIEDTDTRATVKNVRLQDKKLYIDGTFIIKKSI